MDSFSDDGSFAQIPTRPMRVKILYTFDTDGKTTCLARFPNTLQIPVVPIDEQSQVGVIELHQCIQAIVSASPEILLKLDSSDFTVYNYDYTEYDTPLVGQGRLSTLLGASPKGQDKAMITGRVCKNIPALFSNGVKETLEVKFKLTPLANPTTRSFDFSRSMSPATSAGFDPNAWSASINQNKAPQQPGSFFDLNSLAPGGENQETLLEDMFGVGSESSGEMVALQLSSGMGLAETPTDSALAPNPAFLVHPHSAPGSRAGSPIVRADSGTPNEHIRHQSFSAYPPDFPAQPRPESRANASESGFSSQPEPTPVYALQEHKPQQHSEVFFNEDGQPRKRAKVFQTDWRGKSSFGSRSSDLRVTAAAASSMHMHRPIARRATGPGADLEPPPRVPTPVPQRSKVLPQTRQQPRALGSSLREASTVDSDFLSDVDQMSDVFTSPEGSSPGNSITGEGTPLDIPSSPPLLSRPDQLSPSSPALPTLSTRFVDSGYMSERGATGGAVVESCEEDDNRSPEAEDLASAGRYRSRYHRQGSFIKTEDSQAGDTLQPLDRFNVQLEEPGDMNLLPQKHILNLPPHRRGGSQGPRQIPVGPAQETTSAVSHTEPFSKANTPQPDASGSRRGSLALPPKVAPQVFAREESSKLPPKQKRQPIQRSHTANESEAGSPAPSDTESRPRGPSRSGSGAQRRKLIEERLKTAIAKGEMPMFCTHCGAIETPTWRRLYVKEVRGKPSALDWAEGEGETIGIENLQTDEETGEVTSFLIRKSVKKTKDTEIGEGFHTLIVCNPCGLWFLKFKSMRPENKWHRKSGIRKKRTNRDDEGFSTDGVEPRPEAYFTDPTRPEEANEESNSTDDTQDRRSTENEAQPAPRRRLRANSVQPQSTLRDNQGGPLGSHGLIRGVQSSPVRFHGSQESPIELDLTPQRKSTRRLLFPTPRRPGEAKSLEGSPTRPSTPQGDPAARKLASQVPDADQETVVNVFNALTSDSENIAPFLDEHDDLAHLFVGSPSALFKTPASKSTSKVTPRSQKIVKDLLKTPTPSSRKRKALAPNHNAANNADLHVNDLLTSPSGRYFLRSTPSRLERTPGGRSGGGENNLEPSPFSRHLAQMLAEAGGTGSVPLMTSPSRQFDFSDLPTFHTPGRELDWKGLDEILSSEFASYDFDSARADE